ncbi:Telomere-associated protein RIF1 [Nymphon striatum]|nr:Telomere-associated protein RIF1 [Nymphon striatum]
MSKQKASSNQNNKRKSKLNESHRRLSISIFYSSFRSFISIFSPYFFLFNSTFSSFIFILLILFLFWSLIFLGSVILNFAITRNSCLCMIVMDVLRENTAGKAGIGKGPRESRINNLCPEFIGPVCPTLLEFYIFPAKECARKRILQPPVMLQVPQMTPECTTWHLKFQNFLGVGCTLKPTPAKRRKNKYNAVIQVKLDVWGHLMIMLNDHLANLFELVRIFLIKPQLTSVHVTQMAEWFKIPILGWFDPVFFLATKYSQKVLSSNASDSNTTLMIKIWSLLATHIMKHAIEGIGTKSIRTAKRNYRMIMSGIEIPMPVQSIARYSTFSSGFPLFLLPLSDIQNVDLVVHLLFVTFNYLPWETKLSCFNHNMNLKAENRNIRINCDESLYFVMLLMISSSVDLSVWSCVLHYQFFFLFCGAPSHTSNLTQNYSRFLELYKKLISYTIQGNATSTLSFCQSVIQLLTDAVSSISRAESLLQLWVILVEILCGQINKSQEVNQGDSMSHDFTCIYHTLLFPAKFLFTKMFESSSSKLMHSTWNKLYKTFTYCASLVVNLSDNIWCEELCAKLLSLISDQSDFSLDTFYLINNLTKKNYLKPLKASKVLRNIKSLVGLISKVIFNEAESVKCLESTFQNKVSRVSRRVIMAANEAVWCELIKVLSKLFRNIHNSDVLFKLLEELSFPISVDGLWSDVTQSLQLHYSGLYDDKMLELCTPLLKVTLCHSSSVIKKNTRLFWHSTFGQSASLNYPDDLKVVMEKVHPPLISDIQEVSEDSMMSSPLFLEKSPLKSPVKIAKSPSKTSLTALASKNSQKSPARRSILNTSIDDMDTQDFVPIKTPPSTRKRILTKHQKEVLKNERFVPPMYNDLSQDNSELSSQFFSSDTQDADSQDMPSKTGEISNKCSRGNDISLKNESDMQATNSTDSSAASSKSLKRKRGRPKQTQPVNTKFKTANENFDSGSKLCVDKPSNDSRSDQSNNDGESYKTKSESDMQATNSTDSSVTSGESLRKKRGRPKQKCDDGKLQQSDRNETQTQPVNKKFKTPNENFDSDSKLCVDKPSNDPASINNEISQSKNRKANDSQSDLSNNNSENYKTENESESLIQAPNSTDSSVTSSESLRKKRGRPKQKCDDGKLQQSDCNETQTQPVNKKFKTPNENFDSGSKLCVDKPSNDSSLINSEISQSENRKANDSQSDQSNKNNSAKLNRRRSCRIDKKNNVDEKLPSGSEAPVESSFNFKHSSNDMDATQDSALDVDVLPKSSTSSELITDMNVVSISSSPTNDNRTDNSCTTDLVQISDSDSPKISSCSSQSDESIKLESESIAIEYLNSPTVISEPESDIHLPPSVAQSSKSNQKCHESSKLKATENFKQTDAPNLSEIGKEEIVKENQTLQLGSSQQDNSDLHSAVVESVSSLVSDVTREAREDSPQTPNTNHGVCHQRTILSVESIPLLDDDAKQETNKDAVGSQTSNTCVLPISKDNCISETVTSAKNLASYVTIGNSEGDVILSEKHKHMKESNELKPVTNISKDGDNNITSRLIEDSKIVVEVVGENRKDVKLLNLEKMVETADLENISSEKNVREGTEDDKINENELQDSLEKSISDDSLSKGKIGCSNQTICYNSDMISPMSRAHKILQASLASNVSSELSNVQKKEKKFTSPVTQPQKKYFPSPSASPSPSILKKRIVEDSFKKSYSSPKSKRHVSFADPPVLTEAEISLTNHDYLGRKPKKRPVNRCLQPVNDLLEEDLTSSFEMESCDTQQLNSEESIECNSAQPFFPKLITCEHPVVRIISSLTSSIWVHGLEQQLVSLNVTTIGEFCKLSEMEVKSLPIKEPKLSTARNCLSKYSVNSFNEKFEEQQEESSEMRSMEEAFSQMEQEAGALTLDSEIKAKTSSTEGTLPFADLNDTIEEMDNDTEIETSSSTQNLNITIVEMDNDLELGKCVNGTEIETSSSTQNLNITIEEMDSDLELEKCVNDTEIETTSSTPNMKDISKLACIVAKDSEYMKKCSASHLFKLQEDLITLQHHVAIAMRSKFPPCTLNSMKYMVTIVFHKK